MLEFSIPNELTTLMDLLTEREWEVLEKLAEGKSDWQIAKELYISKHTVDGHKRKIFKKLGVHKRTHAARYYILYQVITNKVVSV